MSSYPRSEADQILQSLAEQETRLALANLAIEAFKEEVYAYEENDPRYLNALKLLYETRFRFAHEVMRMTMLKAELGVVGNSWYNVNRKRLGPPTS